MKSRQEEMKATVRASQVRMENSIYKLHSVRPGKHHKKSDAVRPVCLLWTNVQRTSGRNSAWRQGKRSWGYKRPSIRGSEASKRRRRTGRRTFTNISTAGPKERWSRYRQRGLDVRLEEAEAPHYVASCYFLSPPFKYSLNQPVMKPPQPFRSVRMRNQF